MTKLNSDLFIKESAILEAIPDATVIVDETGTIVFINAQTEKLFGYEKKELIGQKVEILIPEPYRAHHPEHRNTYFQKPKTRAMGIGMELFGQRKNGEVFPVEISLSPLSTEEGKFAISSIRDISERKKYEKTIESEKLFRQFAENIKEVFFRLSPDMKKMIYVSPAYEDIWGRTTASLYADPNSWTEAILEDDLPKVIEFLNQISQQDSSCIEYRILTPDNIVKTIFANIFKIKEKGSVTAIIGIATDLTELNQLKAQANLNDKLKMLGTLAASVAHEINSPIAWILGNLEMIKNSLHAIDPQELNELINESIAGAERIGNIVGNLKGFARMDGKGNELIDVNLIVDSVILMAASEINKKAHLKITLGSHLPYVFGNNGKLHQVILNLVMNAIQAFPVSNPEQNQISISTEELEGQIKVNVADNGIGIDEYNLCKIFEPFFTTKPAGIGSGLGLPISLEIVKKMGGTITVSTIKNQGTTFSVWLPISKERKSLTDNQTPKKSKEENRKNILLIDDEPLLLRSIARLLKDYHSVHTANSGKEALEILSKNTNIYDVIITDLNMPRMSGKDLYEFIRNHFPSLENKIIFMTGESFSGELKDFVTNTHNLYIEKPFELSHLLNLINEMETNK